MRSLAKPAPPTAPGSQASTRTSRGSSSKRSARASAAAAKTSPERVVGRELDRAVDLEHDPATAAAGEQIDADEAAVHGIGCVDR